MNDSQAVSVRMVDGWMAHRVILQPFGSVLVCSHDPHTHPIAKRVQTMSADEWRAIRAAAERQAVQS